MSKRLPRGSMRGELARIARDRIALADRDQRRLGDARHFRRRQALARAADAGGERGKVALRLLGEGAEHALRRIGEALERRRLHRLARLPPAARRRARAGRRARRGSARAPAPARRARGRPRCARPSNSPSRRRARSSDARADSPRPAPSVGCDSRLGAYSFWLCPVAAVVERDDPAPGLGEGLHPARIDPVDAMVGGEAVDQEDRLAEVVP